MIMQTWKSTSEIETRKNYTKMLIFGHHMCEFQIKKLWKIIMIQVKPTAANFCFLISGLTKAMVVILSYLIGLAYVCTTNFCCHTCVSSDCEELWSLADSCTNKSSKCKFCYTTTGFASIFYIPWNWGPGLGRLEISRYKLHPHLGKLCQESILVYLFTAKHSYLKCSFHSICENCLASYFPNINVFFPQNLV